MSSDDLVNDALMRVDAHLRTTPFIMGRLQEAGIDQGSLSLANLDGIAPTTKDMLREVPWQQRMSSRGDAEMLLQSSGTTGEPTVYAWSQSDLDHVGTVTGRFRDALGCGPSDVGAVWAPTATSVMGRCMVAEFVQSGSACHVLGAVPPPEAMARLSAANATILKGLPGAVTALTTVELEPLALRQVHVGGDILLESARARIESSLSCSCYNFFGLSEVYGPIAAECRAQSGMHYLSGDVLLEVLDPSTSMPVEPGGVGLGVFTTLWDKVSPTLRYWSNDLIQVDESPCSCGDTTPRITHHGRFFGCDYEGRAPLSQLLMTDMFDRHIEGLRDYHVRLTDEQVMVTVIAAGGIRTSDLLDELEAHVRTSVNVELGAGDTVRPKPGSFADLRTVRT